MCFMGITVLSEPVHLYINDLQENAISTASNVPRRDLGLPVSF